MRRVSKRQVKGSALRSGLSLTRNFFHAEDDALDGESPPLGMLCARNGDRRELNPGLR